MTADRASTPIRRRERPDDFAESHRTLRDSGIHTVLAGLLSMRGVSTPETARHEQPLIPVNRLAGIGEFADAVADGIRAGDRFTVVADYDCDGATACAIALLGLGRCGAAIGFTVPNRMVHGYGLTPSVVDLVLEQHPETRHIITVDNGIASVDGVSYANSKGLTVLVTDHHLPGAALPDARVMVNPNLPWCGFPSKGLAGCGVMLYCVAATARKISEERPEMAGALRHLPHELSDIVALGTVADVVTLDANNRKLVNMGLRRIRHGLAHPGIKALFDVAGRDISRATSSDFGFSIAPRLNAAGRLEDMSLGIRCLVETDYDKAYEMASELDAINRRRREIEGEMRDAAEAEVAHLDGAMTRVAFGEGFHEGVIGIVAGRIKEASHRPTVVFAPASGEDGMLKGSGRSIEGVHLRDVLDLVHKRGNGLFEKFGGHAMAAGMTLRKDRLDEFRRLFEDATAEWLGGEAPEKEWVVDGDLPDVHLGDTDIIRILEEEVWGQAFPPPMFTGTFTVLSVRRVGSERNHLSMNLGRGEHRYKSMRFFADRDGREDPEPGSTIVAVYQPQTNEWQGDISVNLILQDWHTP